MDIFDQVILPPERRQTKNTAGGQVAPGGAASPESILRGLNPPQAEAVRHIEGPLLILAGAGSGKTRVITHRVAWLVSNCGVSPSSILAITFTNKAAAEMKARVEKLVGPVSLGMWIGTFHAMMLRILRRFADRIGYDRNFSIIDTDDQLKIIKNSIRELNLDEKAFLPKAVHAQIGSAKNALTGVSDFLKNAGQDFRLNRIAEVYERYQSKLKQNNCMDFDDILFETVRLFQDHPDVLAEYQERFRYILVDEYQDTNHAQYRLVRLLSDKYRNLCVVGDDDQSIYSFRGANIQNILDFESDFKHCKVIKLEQNYRSTGTVLKAANSVIDQNKGRKKKSLWTSSGDGEQITFLRAENHTEEGRYIADEIYRQVVFSGRRNYSDFAILYRLNALSRSLESALRDKGIPYRIFGGMRFYDRKEIKDVLAYLRLVIKPDDNLSLVRAIQVPRRGIGDTTLGQLEKIAAREKKGHLAICHEAGRFPELARMAVKLGAFADLIGRLREKLRENTQNFPEFIEWVEHESGLVQEIIDQQEKNAEGFSIDRIENLKELISDAIEFSDGLLEIQKQNDIISLPPEDQDLLASSLEGILSAFLERAALYSEMDEDRETRDYVRLMTIHSAKGLEFGAVFLVGAEEGLFPGYRAIGSEADIEEERRLAYVAMTRAKQKIYITTARNRLVFGQTQSLAVSRFVREIPARYIEEIGGSREGDRQYRFSFQTTMSMDPGTAAKHEKRQAEIEINLKKGDRVRHARFGPGKVLSVEPVAGDAILLVEFTDGAQKRMMARMARLERISDVL